MKSQGSASPELGESLVPASPPRQAMSEGRRVGATNPASPRRILWVFEHANPYNIYLLNELNRRLPIPSEALYVSEHLPSHPWTDLPARGFIWSEYEAPGRYSLRLLRRVIEEEDLMVVFNAWRDRSMRAAMLLCRLLGRRYIIWTDTPREVRTWTLFERGRKRVLQTLIAGASAILGTGKPAEERYAQLGFDMTRFHSLPWIVDLDHFGRAVANRELSPAGELTVIQSGRMIEAIKGQGVTLDAIAELRRTDPELLIRLILVGSGIDEERLRRRVEDRGLGESVVFAGWVGYGEMPSVLAEADVLVQPSFYDPYPVAVIEGMAAGLPILGSTACGSVRELVREGIDGFHHAPGDASTLGRQLALLARDPARRKELGASSRAAVEPWGAGYAAEILRAVSGLPRAQEIL